MIESGLHEGEQVAMNPRAYLDYVSLPKLPPEEVQRAVPQPASATHTAQNPPKANTEKAAVRPEAGAAGQAAQRLAVARMVMQASVVGPAAHGHSAGERTSAAAETRPVATTSGAAR